MAITRAQKTSILTALQKEAENQKAVLFFTTKGAKETVNAQLNYEFRSKARENGVLVQIAKNTLIKLAFPSISEPLVGQTYVAVLMNTENQSEVDVPKTIVSSINDDFSKQFDIVGSVVNGEFYSKEKTIALSKVPSFDESMSMIAGSIKSITAKIARTVNEIPASVARGVKAAKAE